MAGRDLLNPQAQGGRNLLEGQEMSWAEVGEQAIKNVPASGQKFFSDMWNAVRHPIDTGGTLIDVAQGAMRLMVPGGDHPDEAKARAVGQFFADRYGSVEGFKRAVATDPVGVLGDFATVLTGGGAAAARAPGLAGKIGGVAQKAGQVIDPINLAGKAAKPVWGGINNVPVVGHIPGVKDVASTAFGALTGTGAAPIIRAGEAGFRGGEHSKAFIEGMREPAALDRIVGQAKSALGNIKKAASNSYIATMKGLSESNKVLDFSLIDHAFADILEMGRFKGVDIAPSTQKVIQDMGKVLDEWRGYVKTEYHTPMGLDALKKRIWDVGEGAAWGTAEKKAVGSVYNAIKDTITKKAPEYGKAMKDYERAKNLVADIEHSLKIGKTHMADTSIRSLTSIMRNNVNTNYGKRLSLAQVLEEGGAPTMIDSIAGASMNSPMPRGLQGATTAATGLAMGGGVAGDIIPAGALAALPFTSPRFVGELAHAGGRAAGAVNNIAKTRLAQQLAGPGKRLAANELGRMEADLRAQGMYRGAEEGRLQRQLLRGGR